MIRKQPLVAAALVACAALRMVNPSEARGQEPPSTEEPVDTVVLKSNRELKGNISEFRQGSEVVLLLGDGGKMFIRWADILRVESRNPLYKYSEIKEEDLDTISTKDGGTLKGQIKEFRRGEDVVLLLPDGRQTVILWGNIVEIDSKNPFFSTKNTSPRTAPPEGSTDKNLQQEISTKGAIGFSSEKTLENAEARRQAWLARGGPQSMFSLQALALGVLMPTTTTTLGSCTIETSSSALGLGASARLGVMNLKLPENGGTWWAFKLAGGADFTVASLSSKTSVGSSCVGVSPDDSSSDMKYLQIPANIGVHVGLKTGKGEAWEGVVLGASWAPSYSYIMPSSGSGSGSFNYYGFDFSLDFATLRSTMDKQAQKAHVRATAFILPPFSDTSPAFFSASLGAVWY